MFLVVLVSFSAASIRSVGSRTRRMLALPAHVSPPDLVRSVLEPRLRWVVFCRLPRGWMAEEAAICGERLLGAELPCSRGSFLAHRSS